MYKMKLSRKKGDVEFEGRKDQELMELFRESSSATKAIIKREEEVERLRKEIKALNKRRFERWESIRAQPLPSADKHIVEKEIENVREQIHLIEEKVINDLLEEIRLLNILIVDSVKAKNIIEGDENLTDKERKLIIRTLKETHK